MHLWWPPGRQNGMASKMKDLFLFLIYTHCLWYNNVQGGTLITDPSPTNHKISNTSIVGGDSELKITEDDDHSEITRCHSDVSNTLFNQGLRLAVGSIKNRLADGIPEYGIPPLEPLEIDPMYIPMSKTPIELNASFKDLKIWDLTTFTKTNWFLDVATRTLGMSLTLPTLLVTGQFTILPVGLKGNVSIQFDAVRVKAKTKLKILDTSRERKKTPIKADKALAALSFDKVRIRMSDMFPNDDKEYAKLNYALRVFTERYSDLLYEEVKPYINAGAEGIVLGLTDAILNSPVFQSSLPLNGILPGLNIKSLTNLYDRVRNAISVQLPAVVTRSNSYRSIIGLLEESFKACRTYTEATDQLTDPLINLFGLFN